LVSLNADGFGVGWYGEKDEPGLFKDELPAWSNENLHEICKHTKASIFFAHVRARTTGVVQRSNCHPFKYKNWLFQHNGHVDSFEVLRQDLHKDIAPEFYAELSGTTDSETLFLLALTYGLMDNPHAAMKKVVERVRGAAKERNTSGIINLSCTISDGEHVWTTRYAEKEEPMTQFYSTESDWISDESGEKTIKQKKSVIIVSEPIDKLNKAWVEIPPNSFTTTVGNHIEIDNFI
ncbi:MAG: class II glutamine amidotransferase, partial [Pseudomonadota bacterium]|nr:class II glutamine amidotransferase [Pseudomonadota bacterium]